MKAADLALSMTFSNYRNPNLQPTMSKRTSLLRIVFCSGFMSIVAFAPMAWGQDRDRVFVTKGGPSSAGKIIKRTRDNVIVQKVAGKEQSIPSNEIERIVFDGEPSSLSKAKDNSVQGNWDEAESDINQVSAGTLKTDEMKEEYDFYKVYIAARQALRGKGGLDKAKDPIIAHVRKYSNSQHFYASSEVLGDLEMALNQPAQATRYYGVLAGSPFDDLKAKGNYLTGRALLADGKATEAKAKFAALVDGSFVDTSSKKLQKLASVAMVKCDAKSGDPNTAIAALEKMVAENDSSDAELFAELYNTLGALFESQNNHYEAVLSFLKTDKLYQTQPEAHAEALYNLSQLWTKVGEPLRAAESKAELVKRYPTSPWTKK